MGYTGNTVLKRLKKVAIGWSAGSSWVSSAVVRRPISVWERLDIFLVFLLLHQKGKKDIRFTKKKNQTNQQPSSGTRSRSSQRSILLYRFFKNRSTEAFTGDAVISKTVVLFIIIIIIVYFLLIFFFFAALSFYVQKNKTAAAGARGRAPAAAASIKGSSITVSFASNRLSICLFFCLKEIKSIFKLNSNKKDKPIQSHWLRDRRQIWCAVGSFAWLTVLFFYWVSMGFTGFYWFFSGFDWV